MHATIAALAITVMVGCGSAARPVSSPAPGGHEELGVADLEHEEEDDGSADLRDGERDDGRGADGFDRRDDDDRRSEHRAGPRVGEVLTAAYAAAGLDGRLPGHIALRARLGGLVPWVSVRTGRDASWHDDDPDVGRGTVLEVRATWRLDRLVFDGRELQVVALEAARRRERRRLATHVIRTYFVWKRPGSRTRAEEAAAELDALTSGWFSEARRRSASEVRTVLPAAATP